MFDFLHQLFWPIFSAENWTAGVMLAGIVVSLFVCVIPTKRLIRGVRPSFWPWLLVLFVVLYIGTRPCNLYGDSVNYSQSYDLLRMTHRLALLSEGDPLFYVLMNFFLGMYADCSPWFLSMTIIYVGGIAWTVRRLFPRHFFLALLLYFTSFFFFAYGTNTIRAGAAGSMVLLGVTFFLRSKKDYAVGSVLCACGVLFHLSMLLPVACAAAALKWRNLNRGVALWVFCAILAFILPDTVKDWVALHGGNDHYVTYATVDLSQHAGVFSRIGYRWDFLLFSLPPILLGWYVIKKRDFKDKFYAYLLQVYIYANSFWVLINTIVFSDRFAYLSWIFYPILMLYPLVKTPMMKVQGLAVAFVIMFYVILHYLL